MPASELRANPKNWRRHPPAQARALRSILDQVGYADALLARETAHGLELIDGHLRAETTPDAEVPVLVLDVTEAEADLILATLDPLAAMADADEAKLRTLLEAVAISDADLLAELEALVPEADRKAGQTDPDEVGRKPAKPTTRLGDTWVLGDHRLVCADATAPESWNLLMQGAIGDLLWTDPPYGVAYQHKLSTEEAAARHRRLDGKDLQNDELDEAGLEKLLREAFAEALTHLRLGGGTYIAAPSGPQMAVFLRVALELGFMRQTLTWVKDVFVMGRQDYHYRHETLVYGWKPGGRHRFRGGRTQDTVWEIPRPRRSEDHPTMKPVELVARAIENSSVTGGTVLDPFAGSGSTIIAAEQTGRRCYAMDIDPAYVDVAVKRWETFAGKKAERIRG